MKDTNTGESQKQVTVGPAFIGSHLQRNVAKAPQTCVRQAVVNHPSPRQYRSSSYSFSLSLHIRAVLCTDIPVAAGCRLSPFRDVLTTLAIWYRWPMYPRRISPRALGKNREGESSDTYLPSIEMGFSGVANLNKTSPRLLCRANQMCCYIFNTTGMIGQKQEPSADQQQSQQ